MSIPRFGKLSFRVKRIILIIASCFVFLLFIVCAAQALTPAPDIGVDYQTMKVDNPQFLEKKGMRDVRKGDKIDLVFTQDGQLTITNIRTSEKITVPIYKQVNDEGQLLR